MTKPSNSENPKNRRAFLRGFATAAAIGALPALPRVAWGAISPPGGAAAQQPGPAPSPEVAALAELVRSRYGAYLEDRDAPALRRGLERISRAPAALLKVKITNGNAPDCLFLPDAP